MATFRFYRSPRIGDGSRTNPFRSKLTQYIDGANGTFWDWIHDGRAIRYALAQCETITHTLIGADIEIRALSAELADEAALTAWLNDTFDSLPQAAKDQLESDGLSTSWATLATLRRQMLRYAAKVHVCTQDLRRLRDADSTELFRRALTEQANDLTAVQRQKVRDWMAAKGLDTSWIVGSTPLRQIIHYVVENVDWPILALGPATF